MIIIKKFKESNTIILGISFLLFLIGLLGLASISIHQGGSLKSGSFLKQMLFIFPGIILFLFTFLLPKAIYHKFAYWIYGVILISVILPFIGPKIAGTHRWIDIGIIGIQIIKN